MGQSRRGPLLGMGEAVGARRERPSEHAEEYEGCETLRDSQLDGVSLDDDAADTLVDEVDEAFAETMVDLPLDLPHHIREPWFDEAFADTLVVADNASVNSASMAAACGNIRSGEIVGVDPEVSGMNIGFQRQEGPDEMTAVAEPTGGLDVPSAMHMASHSTSLTPTLAEHMASKCLQMTAKVAASCEGTCLNPVLSSGADVGVFVGSHIQGMPQTNDGTPSMVQCIARGVSVDGITSIVAGTLPAATPCPVDAIVVCPAETRGPENVLSGADSISGALETPGTPKPPEEEISSNIAMLPAIQPCTLLGQWLRDGGRAHSGLDAWAYGFVPRIPPSREQ